MDPSACIENTPRRVAPSVIVAAYFGGRVVQISWVLLLIALMPIWYCVNDESFDLIGTFALLGPTHQVPGRVTSLNVVRETDLGDGGVGDAFGIEVDHMFRQDISRIRYVYTGPEGRTFTGEAQVRRGDEAYCEEGRSITVEYSTYNPSISKVVGLRTNWGSKATFVMVGFWVFFLGSLWLIYPIGHGLARGSRAKRLLRYGAVTEGQFCGARSRGFWKLYHVTEMTHSYAADGREFTSTRVRVDDVTEEPAETELLFYDAAQPARAMVLSDLPAAATIDDSGAVSDEANGYNCLCAPMLCAFGYGWFVLHMLGAAPAPSLSLLY
jgi:hypothetical protein